MKRHLLSSARLAALSLLIALTGCKTVNELKGNGPFPVPGYGYVVARIVSEVGPDVAGAPYTYPPTISAHFKEAGDTSGWTNPAFSMTTNLFDSQPQITANNEVIREETVVVRARPGEYRLWSLGGQVIVLSLAVRPKNIGPFTVKEGEVTYIGRIRLSTTMGKNLFGTPVPASGAFSLSDHFEADVAELKKRDPRMSSARLINAGPAQRSQIVLD